MEHSQFTAGPDSLESLSSSGSHTLSDCEEGSELPVEFYRVGEDVHSSDNENVDEVEAGGHTKERPEEEEDGEEDEKVAITQAKGNVRGHFLNPFKLVLFLNKSYPIYI